MTYRYREIPDADVPAATRRAGELAVHVASTVLVDIKSFAGSPDQWVIAQLDKRDRYLDMIRKMVLAGSVRWLVNAGHVMRSG